MPPKVSVIVSVHNGENYLAEAIVSILKQDYPHREILIIDDGSTDGTSKIIQSFGNKIRAIYQSNQGLGAGRNTGIHAATGDYFAFLDHDDFWSQDKLSSQIAQICSEDPILFSCVQQFICPTLSKQEQSKLNVNEAILPGYLAGTMLISKKRFLEVGYFTEKNEVGEFIDWFLRAKEAGIPMKLVNQTTLFRRVHRHNMGRKPDLYTSKAYLHVLKASLDRRRNIKTTALLSEKMKEAY